MNTLVIEHVALSDLPASWRSRLPVASDARLTVRIEEEPHALPPDTSSASDIPFFGIWRDREDLADVATYARQLREPRFMRKD